MLEVFILNHCKRLFWLSEIIDFNVYISLLNLLCSKCHWPKSLLTNRTMSFTHQRNVATVGVICERLLLPFLDSFGQFVATISVAGISCQFVADIYYQFVDEIFLPVCCCQLLPVCCCGKNNLLLIFITSLLLSFISSLLLSFRFSLLLPFITSLLLPFIASLLLQFLVSAS